MDEDELPTNEDRLGIDIEIIVQDGEITEVFYKGAEARALVRNYDVAFPCVAHNLDKDEDGDFFTEVIV